MMNKTLLLLFGVVIAVTNAAFSEHIVVENVDRTIDISSAFVKVDAVVTFKSEQDSVSKFHVVIPEADVAHVSYISATDSHGNRLAVTKDPKNGEAGRFAAHVVKLGKKLEEGKSMTMTISFEYTSLLKPYPKEIKQTETQLMLYNGNHFFVSPYKVLVQRTDVSTGTHNIESYTKRKPSSKKGDTITLGPYKNKDGLASSSFTVHYENEAPFATVRLVQREVEVSHWGAVSVEELYELEHTGAKLIGGFSRIDYQKHRQHVFGSSFQQLEARLPAGAHGAYYRDQIGNISTSALRHDLEQQDQLLELQTRFPLFGGWGTKWYNGYLLPVQNVLSSDGVRFSLAVDLLPALRDVAIDELSLKVVLPEGAAEVEYTLPAGVEAEEERSLRFTYLDVWGRPVLTLRARALGPATAAAGKLVVTYTFPFILMLQEPLMLAAASFVLFACVMVGLRVRLHITRPAEDVEEERRYLESKKSHKLE